MTRGHALVLMKWINPNNTMVETTALMPKCYISLVGFDHDTPLHTEEVACRDQFS
ncbi:hypothetical protein [Nocardia sp. NPDC057440]|uniref:hypothetical protein n=1 Tax=Nocardia sp. NPDC057440 TaxID=3346134 RepID=UPI00366E2DDE